MATKRITKRSVDALRCKTAKDRSFLWDDALAGFGVAAYASGKKVYVAQYRQNGRSRRVAVAEHGRVTPDEARVMAKKLLGAVEDGVDPIEQRRAARGVRNFREVAEEFMRVHVEAKRKGRTHEEYERLLRLHIFPALGSRRVVDVRRADVARLHAKLSNSKGAANRCLALISSTWNWAARRDEVSFAQNPARGVERYPENSRERFLTSEEIGRLGDALRLGETKGIPWAVDEHQPNAKHIPKKDRRTTITPHTAAAIRLLILTGARLREILDAKWESVDWQRGIMFLPDSKTGKKPLYLSAVALAVLKAVPRVGKNPFIIPGQGSKKSKTANTPKAATKQRMGQEGNARADLKRPWAAVARAARLEDVRLHDLRHSFASVGAGASLGLPIIGKLLGHSQPATTARYSHLDADPLRRAADVIGGQIAASLERLTGEVVELKSARAKL
jgi:integrase